MPSDCINRIALVETCVVMHFVHWLMPVVTGHTTLLQIFHRMCQ